MTIRPIFAWYDLWVGAYYDRRNRRLYVLPVPCLGVVVDVPTLDDVAWRAAGLPVVGWLGDALLVRLTGDDRAGWEAEAEDLDRFMAAEDRWSGFVVCGVCREMHHVHARRDYDPANYVCHGCATFLEDDHGDT